MNPPPSPSKPPTIPARMPQQQHIISWCIFQSVLPPLDAIVLFPLYKQYASYPDTPRATGICVRKSNVQYDEIQKEKEVTYIHLVAIELTCRRFNTQYAQEHVVVQFCMEIANNLLSGVTTDFKISTKVKQRRHMNL